MLLFSSFLYIQEDVQNGSNNKVGNHVESHDICFDTLQGKNNGPLLFVMVMF